MTAGNACRKIINALFVVLRGEFRARQTLRSLRHASGWTIAGVLWLVLGLAFRSWVMFVAFGVLMLLSLSLWARDRYYLARAELDDLDEMTGWEFESWLDRFFKGRGFHEVRRTPYRGDFGADFVLTWNGMKIAVQAKRSRRAVGVTAVQQVVAAKSYYGCELAMVVTNNYFTDEASILAHANNVRLRTRDDLAKALTELGLSAAGVPALAD